MTRCNTKHAPWYIVPANRKWYRNLVVSRILRQDAGEDGPRNIRRPKKGLEGSGGGVRVYNGASSLFNMRRRIANWSLHIAH